MTADEMRASIRTITDRLFEVTEIAKLGAAAEAPEDRGSELHAVLRLLARELDSVECEASRLYRGIFGIKRDVC